MIRGYIDGDGMWCGGLTLQLTTPTNLPSQWAMHACDPQRGLKAKLQLTPGLIINLTWAAKPVVTSAQLGALCDPCLQDQGQM